MLYKSDLDVEKQIKINSPLDELPSDEESNRLPFEFHLLCEKFVQNINSNNLQELNEIVENIKKYAFETENPILNEFDEFNLAFYLMKFLDIDETPNTATCISYCLAHEDEISTYFIGNNFLAKASELLQKDQFVSPIITALGNIAACSDTNIDLLLKFISYDNIIELSMKYADDENIMNKLFRLLMNISQRPPVPVSAFQFFIKTFNDPPGPHSKVLLYTLWCLHNSLSEPTELKKSCAEDNLIENILKLIIDESNQDFLYIEINLLVDLIKIFPESFNDFDLKILVPLFDSENRMLAKSAMLFFKEICKKNISNLIEDNFLDMCRSILDQSSFKIKYDICLILSSIIDNLDTNNLISLINQGIVEILDADLEFDDEYLLMQTVKSLTRLVNAATRSKNTKKDFTNSSELSPAQTLAMQIDKLNIYQKIEDISSKFDDENLENEIKIFKSTYQTKIFGVYEEE